MSKEYLSPTGAAKILKISRQAVIERIKHGSLAAERAGRQYIIQGGGPGQGLTVVTGPGFAASLPRPSSGNFIPTTLWIVSTGSSWEIIMMKETVF